MARTQVSPPASVEQQEIEHDQKKPKTRRPPNTAFRQQRLKAWQPILTPKSVLPLFFAVGIIFAPIGGLLLWASEKVQEISIEYTNCATLAPTGNFEPISDGSVSSHFSSSNTSVNAMWRRSYRQIPYGSDSTVNTTICELQFDIPIDIGPPVLFYYRLTKFNQNHRRYVKSLDQDQLEGHFRDNASIDGSYCDPLTLDDNGFAYYPCGLIANSLFNDTFDSPYILNVPGGSSDNRTYYHMTNQGIAWSSDASLYGASPYTPDQVVPPPNWRKRYPRYDNDTYKMPDLKGWEEFQVWMRTAGLPTFSKLALRNDTVAMPAGTYRISIQDDFPVTEYGGTKEILISTRTIMGGKNPYLGIAYIVVGGICMILGAVFLAMHLIKPRKLGDHTYLTWNNEPATAAVATGRSLRPNEGA